MTRWMVERDWAQPVVLADERPVARTRSGDLTRADLLRRAQALAARLPVAPAALNLCEHREHYLAALLALEMRGQVCLMPPSRAAAVLDDVQAAHPGSVRIDDSTVEAALTSVSRGPVASLVLDGARVVAIGYTSGSTGRPKANPKTWRSFAGPAWCNARELRLQIDAGEQAVPWLVATVPSQHMYGMECTAILPLLEGVAIHSSHPLFPADVAAALADVPAPRVLVSTPVHLRALLESGITLPPLAAVVSATAPLSAELAAQVEARLATRALEFFGSTETCVIASRRTATGGAWMPYPGLSFARAGDGMEVSAPWLDAPVPMLDVFEPAAGGGFHVVGRSADMIDVAGKRTSLADLTRRLLAVPGVRDAVIVQPAGAEGGAVRRLIAFVVSDGPSAAAIADALAGQVDPVFIPRPIVCVERLPRNEVGKLPRDELLRLVREHALDGPAR